MQYIAYLHKESKSDYGVSFPDFPGCITAGSSLEEARQMAVEALTLHIAGMKEDGEVIPEPSSLDDLQGDPAMKGAVAVLVDVAEAEKTVRINITARESQIAEINRLAAASGLNRSAFIIQKAIGGGKLMAEKRAVASFRRQRVPSKPKTMTSSK